MVCANCGATLAAASRFCDRCGAPQVRACTDCRHENAPDAIFCGACGARLATPRAASPAPAQAERRQLTVMFCDLVGSTALSTRLDPEDLREVISAYHGCVAGIVDTLQGHVAQYLGDGALVYFGYPHATENDAERALRAALAVTVAVAALNPLGQKLCARVGVATGPVVVGDIIGPASRAERGAIGEVLNLAARLQALAEPDAVVAAHATHQLAERQFDWRDLGAHDLKGFAEPIRVWHVLAAVRADGAEAPRSSRGPLAGRHAELARFQSALGECAQQRHGQVLYLRGEAGIGKTRLIEAFAAGAREQGWAVHSGLVLDFGTGVGRDAIGTLAHDLLGLPAGAPAEAALAAITRAIEDGLADTEDEPFLHDLLGAIPPPALRTVHEAMDLGTRAAGRRRTVARLVTRASRVRPRLLTVEDLHWADAGTLAQLATLAAGVVDCAALLVLSARPEPDPLDASWRAQAAASPLVEFEIGPLRAEEAALLTGPWLAQHTEVAQRCIERAAGNPLFLEQLLRHAEEGGAGAVPASVQGLVQARLDRLEPAHKQALQAACVLGQRFDRAALAHLIEAPAPEPAMLLAHSMVHRHGSEFLFAHALIHEAVYDGLLKSRRRALHLRAARWFATRDTPLAAAHLERAGDPGAARAYLEAARTERQAYRHAAARTLAERGRALASDDHDRFELDCLLGDIRHELGDMAAALAAFTQAASVATSDAQRCRAWIGCAQVKRVIDDLDGAFADLDRAQGVAAGLPAEEARLHFLRGNLYFPRGDIAGCIREHTRSLELARAAGAAALEAEALGGLGDAEYMLGRMRSANARFQACIALSEQHGLGRIASANRPMAAFTRWLAGDITAALKEAETAIAAARGVGHLRAEMIGHHGAFFALQDMLRLAPAAGHAEDAMRIARQLKAPRFEAQGMAMHAQLAHNLARHDEARTLIREAIAITRHSGMAYMGAATLGVAALVLDDAAERHAALDEGEQVLASGALSHNHLLFARNAIDACLAMGDWSRAGHHAALLEAYTRAEPLAWSELVIARGRALAAAGCDPASPGQGEPLRRLLRSAEEMDYAIGLPALRRALARVAADS